MAEPIQQLTIDGQEAQKTDLNNVFKEAALADDRLLAELLRIVPDTGGVVTKAILPTGHLASVSATVKPSGSANSRVVVMPFRAVIGSRTAISSAPTAIDNWRDIRSSVYAPTDDNATFGHAVTFGANASGNPRWDLVYVAFTPDANGPSGTRYVKPAIGSAAPQTVVPQLVQTIAIAVAPGTPGALPAFPAVPSDAAGTYYIPLAYVRIPNGFGGASTIDARDIRDVAPVVTITRAMGGSGFAPANGQNKVGGAMDASTNYHFTGAANQRPGPYMPPTMAGKESIVVAMKLGDISANNSHPIAGVIDDSRDWRNRVFLAHAYARDNNTNVNSMSWERPTANATCTPMATITGTRTFWQMGQSFFDDASGVSTHAITGGLVLYATSAQLGDIAGGSAILVYVDAADGKLKVDYPTTAPGVSIVLWIDATAPYPNY